MSRNRGSREIKLRKALKDTLHEKYKLGKSTPKTGKVHNGTELIHSHTTYHTYLDAVDRFADWCKAQGIKTLPEARNAVPAYVQARKEQGKSAFTIAKDVAAIAKSMDCKMTDFGMKLPRRNRENIKNNRGVAERQKSFKETQYRTPIDFIRACGLRRNELNHLRGDQLRLSKNGTAYIRIARGDGSKGGKVRYAEIAGVHKAMVLSMMQTAGQGLVFPEGIPLQVNSHHYRGDYAKMLYKLYSRDVRTLPTQELYICRGSMKGLRFDRKALEIVSKSLGHNRIDVVVNNYFY